MELTCDSPVRVHLPDQQQLQAGLQHQPQAPEEEEEGRMSLLDPCWRPEPDKTDLGLQVRGSSRQSGLGRTGRPLGEQSRDVLRSKNAEVRKCL